MKSCPTPYLLILPIFFLSIRAINNESGYGHIYGVFSCSYILLKRVLVQIALLSVAAVASSCALLVPSSKITFEFDEEKSMQAVFQCAEKTIHQLSVGGMWGDVAATSRDFERGVFETENFKSSNVVGFSMRLNYSPVAHKGVIVVHAVGLYYVDLGANAMAESIKSKISKCLEVVRVGG